MWRYQEQSPLRVYEIGRLLSCGVCLYAGLDEGGDDVQVHVINTQVRGIVVIGWVESLTDM